MEDPALLETMTTGALVFTPVGAAGDSDLNPSFHRLI